MATEALKEAPTTATPSSAIRRVLPWLVAVAFFMESLDTTILNTAVPIVAKAIGFPLGELCGSLVSDFGSEMGADLVCASPVDAGHLGSGSRVTVCGRGSGRWLTVVPVGGRHSVLVPRF